MLKLLSYLSTYQKDENGATAIEYGLLAAFISLAIIATVIIFGQDLSNLFAGLSTALTGAGAGP